MNKSYFDFAKYGSIGIAWVLSTSIYLYLGFRGGTYLDERMGSAPLFMLIGLFLGIGLSIKSLIEQVMELSAELDRRARGEDRRAPDREKNNKK